MLPTSTKLPTSRAERTPNGPKATIRAKAGELPKAERKVTWRTAFWQYIWPRRKYMLLGLLLIVVSRMAGMVLPGSTKYLLDDVVGQGDLQMLWVLLGAVVGALIVQSVTSYALTQLLSVEAQLLISQLRTQVQRKILSLPTSFFDNTKSGALVSRIMSDVEGVRNLVGTGLVQLIGGTLTALISLVQGTARAAFAAEHAREPDEADDTGWWSSIEPTIQAVIGDAGRFPTASRVSQALGEATGKANDPEGAYRRGLALLLDGLAKTARSGHR